MNDSSTSDEVLSHLAKAPALIFLLVAAADGTIDKKEIKQFQKILQDEAYQPLFAAMQELGSNPMAMIGAVQSSPRTPAEDLLILRELLDTLLPAELATNYKVMLLQLAKSIAEASGGFLGLFGSKISKEEKQALAVIAGILGLLDDAADKTNHPPSLEEQGSANYTQASDLPDNLFPALKSAEWAEDAQGSVFIRNIFPGSDPKSMEPVIGYAIDTPQTIAFVNSDQVAEGLDASVVHAKALENLENRLQGQAQWQSVDFDTGIEGVPNVTGLVLEGDYFASEAMLSETLMKQAHEQLNSALLMVIAPVRGELFVSKLISESDAEPERVAFASAAIKRFFNPSQAAISPNVWIARNGSIVGHIAGMEDIIATAKHYGEAEIEAEDAKLEHSVKGLQLESGMALKVNIIAHDVEILLKNLQHVLRNYAHSIIEREDFNGIVKVHVDMQDQDFLPDMQETLNSEMDNMFSFLTEQFASLGLTGKNNAPISLSYHWEANA